MAGTDKASRDRYRKNWDSIRWSVPRRTAVDEQELFEAADRIRRSRQYFSLLGCPPCPDCGKPIEYSEGPPEVISMCSHIRKRLADRDAIEEVFNSISAGILARVTIRLNDYDNLIY